MIEGCEHFYSNNFKKLDIKPLASCWAGYLINMHGTPMGIIWKGQVRRSKDFLFYFCWVLSQTHLYWLLSTLDTSDYLFKFYL